MNPLQEIISWILFARYGNQFTGGHQSAYALVVVAGVVITIEIARRVPKMKGAKYFILPFLPWFVVFFVACLHEFIYFFPFAFANFFIYGTGTQFVNVMSENVKSWGLSEQYYWVTSIAGLILFKNYFQFKKWDWLAFGGVIAVWLAIGFPVTLPLPNGAGPFCHDCYLNNGFEFLYNLTFAIVIMRAYRWQPPRWVKDFVD